MISTLCCMTRCDCAAIMRCHAMLCYAMLCCAVLCCAVLCYAVLCCAVLCCAVLSRYAVAILLLVLCCWMPSHMLSYTLPCCAAMIVNEFHNREFKCIPTGLYSSNTTEICNCYYPD